MSLFVFFFCSFSERLVNHNRPVPFKQFYKEKKKKKGEYKEKFLQG